MRSVARNAGVLLTRGRTRVPTTAVDAGLTEVFMRINVVSLACVMNISGMICVTVCGIV